MVVKTTILRDNMATYVREVIKTNEPLQVTSTYGDFYIISREQFESHKAFEMLTQEFCRDKLNQVIRAVLKSKEGQ